MAHIELGMDNPNLRTPLINLLLKGTEHWDNIQRKLSGAKSRTPVTIDMMRVIKRKLVEAKHDKLTKLTFWAACTLIWNGSLRVHEALARSQNEYDPQSTLLREDVDIFDANINKVNRPVIRVLIKSPKEDRIGRDMSLEIFGNGSFLCPVRALTKYLTERTKISGAQEALPLFIKMNTKCLTGTEFSAMLTDLTSDITKNTSSTVTSHSLRAGVPSELARQGADPKHIQGVGRWSSDAWKDYCKLGRLKRLTITDSLCSAIV